MTTENSLYYCPKCGSKNFETSNYCFKCGMEIDIPLQNRNELINTEYMNNKGADIDDWISETKNSSNKEVTYEYRNVVNGIIQNNNNETSSFGLWWIIAGFISSIIAIFIFPPAFGIFGVICGIFAIKKGSSFGGGFIILLSLICMIIGFVYGATVMMQKISHY